MARGWESKSVESQVEGLETRRSVKKPGLTAEQMEIERKRDGFLLQRKRIMNQLEGCQDERYRKTLTIGLEFLESQLVALGWQR